MKNRSKIAIIGLGLIGGSVLKALAPKNLDLIGISRNQQTLDKALSQNLAAEVSDNVELVRDADVVFICTPINSTLETIDNVRKIVSPQCIITDVASIKGFVMDYVNDYNYPTNFIGGHPMAGTEFSGFDSSFDTLFEGAKWVLTPSRWSGSEDIRQLEELIALMGAKTIVADPYEHDMAVSLISHLPLMLSQGLFGLVEEYPDKNISELAKKLASSGFRDVTRLAATNPELSRDILIKNKPNIRKSLSEFKDFLSGLEELLESDEEKFIKKINDFSEKRREMYSAEGKNKLF